MLLDDLLHDGEAEAGALGLGRHVRLECPAQHVFGNPLPASPNRERKLVARARRARYRTRESATSACASIAFCRRLWNTWRRRVGSPWMMGLASTSLQRDVGAQILVQPEHVLQERVDVDRLHRPAAAAARRSRSRRPCASSPPPASTIVCVPRSSVSWSARVELAAELDGEPFGRKLDRRQRILDLVREPSRDFGPRRVALRLRKLGHVVEHHHVAGAGSPASREPRISSARV